MVNHLTEQGEMVALGSDMHVGNVLQMFFEPILSLHFLSEHWAECRKQKTDTVSAMIHTFYYRWCV